MGAFMLPWLISHFICLVLMSLAVSGLFIMFCVATPGGVMSGLFFLLICSPLMALSFYFWLVVRSVYLDLKESTRTGVLLTRPSAKPKRMEITLNFNMHP